MLHGPERPEPRRPGAPRSAYPILPAAATTSEVECDGVSVAVGVAVKVTDTSFGAVDEYLLIGDFAPPSPSGVSARSAISRALVERAAGDDVDIELPGGRKRRLRIVASRHSAEGGATQSAARQDRRPGPART